MLLIHRTEGICAGEHCCGHTMPPLVTEKGTRARWLMVLSQTERQKELRILSNPRHGHNQLEFSVWSPAKTLVTYSEGRSTL